MNNQSTTAPESFLQPRGLSPATESAARAFFWAIRRELWENRSLYIAPLIAATVFLFAFLVSLFSLRHRVSSSQLNSAQLRDALTTQLDLAAALIMGTAFVVGIFYTLDALYGERRDRSILFWKSLPVSDLTTVLSKFTIPIVVVPMVSFAITLLTQFCMLLLSSVVLAGIGAEVGTVWTGPFLRDSSASSLARARSIAPSNTDGPTRAGGGLALAGANSRDRNIHPRKAARQSFIGLPLAKKWFRNFKSSRLTSIAVNDCSLAH